MASAMTSTRVRFSLINRTYLSHSPLINGRILSSRYSSQSLDIPSDGPPPVGQVNSRSIPKHLRSYDKVFQVRAVIFDFSLLIRDTPIKELVPGAQLISGFDPRHDRFQNSAPLHNVRAWVNGMKSGELMSELESRNIRFDGDSDMLKEKLIQHVKAVNDKWVKGLFGREIREELKEMGLESQGKIETLHHMLSTALLEGYGVPSKHYNMAITNAKNNQLTNSVASKDMSSILSPGINTPKVVKKADNIYPESQLPKELTDITTKYRKKLLAKTGGSLSSLKLSNGPTKGDAEGLNIGRKSLANAAEKNNQISKWLPDSNVGDLLAYLETRSMRVCLLPDPTIKLEELTTFQTHFPSVIFMKPEDVMKLFNTTSSNKSDQVDENKETSSERNSSNGFLSGLFSSLTGSGSQKTKRQTKKVVNEANITSWKECLQRLARVDLELETGRMVVVSDKTELLQAARNLECHTVAFNPPNQMKVGLSTDFSAEDIFDVKEFIERENGISFRK